MYGNDRVGDCEGVIIYNQEEDISPLLENYLDDQDVTDGNLALIRTLLLDGSALTLGELVNIAKSFRD